MKTIRLLVLLLISASSAFAQESAKVWTLQDCIDYAWKNNIQVRQTELTVLTNQQILKQVQWARVPNLNFSASGRNNVGRSIDPFTNLVRDQDITSQSYGLNSSVTLFNGMGQYNTVKQNEALLNKSIHDLENQKNITALSIANQYL